MVYGSDAPRRPAGLYVYLLIYGYRCFWEMKDYFTFATLRLFYFCNIHHSCLIILILYPLIFQTSRMKFKKQRDYETQKMINSVSGTVSCSAKHSPWLCSTDLVTCCTQSSFYYSDFRLAYLIWVVFLATCFNEHRPWQNKDSPITTTKIMTTTIATMTGCMI